MFFCVFVSSGAFFLLLQIWTGYSSQAGWVSFILGLLFAIMQGILITFLLNKMSDLPRACGFLSLFFPIVSLFPHFLLSLNQFLQKYSVKECIKYFKRERLRFVHLQLFLFYIFGGMCRYRIQGWKSFSVQNCDFFLFPWLAVSNAAILQSDAFLITNP